MSKEAAESAQHRLRGLDAPYVQALAPKEPEKPSAAMLTQYGITSEFMDFVRSLTYSTFRDFPADALPTAEVTVLSSSKQCEQYAVRLLCVAERAVRHECSLVVYVAAPA